MPQCCGQPPGRPPSRGGSAGPGGSSLRLQVGSRSPPGRCHGQVTPRPGFACGRSDLTVNTADSPDPAPTKNPGPLNLPLPLRGSTSDTTRSVPMPPPGHRHATVATPICASLAYLEQHGTPLLGTRIRILSGSRSWVLLVELRSHDTVMLTYLCGRLQRRSVGRSAELRKCGRTLATSDSETSGSL